MTWTDGITCSVLRDGDAVAEVRKEDFTADMWTHSAHLPSGDSVGQYYHGIEAAKAAAERAIRTMRGEDADE